MKFIHILIAIMVALVVGLVMNTPIVTMISCTLLLGMFGVYEFYLDYKPEAESRGDLIFTMVSFTSAVFCLVFIICLLVVKAPVLYYLVMAGVMTAICVLCKKPVTSQA